MAAEKRRRFQIVEGTSRQAGACVGRATVIGKTIVEAGAGGAAVVGGWLWQSFRARRAGPASAASPRKLKQPGSAETRAPAQLASRLGALQAEKESLVSELQEARDLAEKVQSRLATQLAGLHTQKEALVSDLDEARHEPNELTDGGHALTDRVAALESELAGTRRELQETRRAAGETESEFAAQLEALEAERGSLVSDLGEARSEASETSAAENAVRERLGEMESELAAARHDLDEAQTEMEHAQARLTSQFEALEAEDESDLPPTRHEPLGRGRGEATAASALEATAVRPTPAEAPDPPEVTMAEVRAAAFADPDDKLILTRALCDIANQDAAVRADAARVMAGIHHELSVRALVAWLAREPSPKVQQDCIKALVKLDAKHGLPVIERFLTNRSASVRLAAVWGLYRLGGVESASALAGVLCDEDEEVRRRAATCIGWLGQKKLAGHLLPLLDDSRVAVRQAAVESLGSLGSRQMIGALIDRLNDPEESIRRAVLAAIETTTGKKMSESMPEDEKSQQLLIARWRAWWKDERPD